MFSGLSSFHLLPSRHLHCRRDLHTSNLNWSISRLRSYLVTFQDLPHPSSVIWVDRKRSLGLFTLRPSRFTLQPTSGSLCRTPTPRSSCYECSRAPEALVSSPRSRWVRGADSVLHRHHISGIWCHSRHSPSSRTRLVCGDADGLVIPLSSK